MVWRVRSCALGAQEVNEQRAPEEPQRQGQAGRSLMKSEPAAKFVLYPHDMLLTHTDRILRSMLNDPPHHTFNDTIPMNVCRVPQTDKQF